jgi:hypothetical protein
MDVLHSSFFHIIFNSLALASNKHHQFPSCTTLNFVFSATLQHFSNSLITLKRFLTDGNFVVSKEMQIGGSKICAVWWVRKKSPFEFGDCVPCFKTCVGSCFVVCKDYFSKVFVRLKFPETLLQTSKGTNLQIWVNGLTMWRNIYQNHHFFFPKISGH